MFLSVRTVKVQYLTGIQPFSSDSGALDSSSAVSSGMTSWTGMISGNLLMSWIVVGGAFLTGLATTLVGAGFGGWTTSLTWGQDRQLSLRPQTDQLSLRHYIHFTHKQES